MLNVTKNHVNTDARFLKTSKSSSTAAAPRVKVSTPKRESLYVHLHDGRNFPHTVRSLHAVHSKEVCICKSYSMYSTVLYAYSYIE